MIKIKACDKKQYVFKENRDYQILEKIYELEKCPLSTNDKMIIKFIRTQLKDDWRKPLLAFLNVMVGKYKK